MDFLTNNWKEVLLAVVGLFAAGFALRFVIRNRNVNRVTQEGNMVMGDQAGRDIIKKK